MRDYLLLATSLAVRGIPLNVSLQEDITLPLTGLGSTLSGSAVEYDGNEEAIFYNDRGRGLVYKSNLNGTSESFQDLCDYVGRVHSQTTKRFLDYVVSTGA